jgi:hypothetical protein
VRYAHSDDGRQLSLRKSRALLLAESKKVNTEENNVVKKTLSQYVSRVPANLDDWQRKIKEKQNLNDLVETCIRAIMKTDLAELLSAFLSPLYDEETIEGSLAADNLEAANLVREYAKANKPFADLAGKKKATIGKAIRVVMRRYHLGARERRQTVGGEIVVGNSGD